MPKFHITFIILYKLSKTPGLIFKLPVYAVLTLATMPKFHITFIILYKLSMTAPTYLDLDLSNLICQIVLSNKKACESFDL